MEAGANVHNLLGILLYQYLFSANIKHGYWTFNVHPDKRYYLAFHVPGINQVQPICMSQVARTSVFTFGELINIVFGPIFSPMPEPSPLHAKTPKDSASLAFYMDDIFGVFKTYQEQYIFLRDHFFLRIVWSKLKLAFFKLKIGMTQIFAFGKEHEIEKRIRLNQIRLIRS